MENKPTIKTPIQTASGFHNFAFCTLHFDFPTPTLPIQPSLPLVLLSLIPCALPPFVPSCLSGHESIMQNKPNFQIAKIPATSYATGIYTNPPLRPAPKNKPKQTQFPRPAGVAHPPVAARIPRRFTLHASRSTRYDIRHPTYEIRSTDALLFCLVED